MGQGDPGGQYQAGVIVGPIFHKLRSANRGAPMSARWRPRASAPGAAVLARQRADAQLAALYRERDIARAQAAVRDSRQ
jgi:hypothetical protein